MHPLNTNIFQECFVNEDFYELLLLIFVYHSILLDHSEASIVREQAACLLTNLLKNRASIRGHGDNVSNFSNLY